MKSIRTVAAPALLLVAGALAAFMIAGAVSSGDEASAHPAGGTTGIDVASGTTAVGGPAVSIAISMHDIPAPGHRGYNFSVGYPAGITRTTASVNACLDGMAGPGSAASPAAPGPGTYFRGCADVDGVGPFLDASPGPLVIATMQFTCQVAGVYALDLDGTGGPATAAYANALLTLVPVGNAGDGTITCTTGPTSTPTPTATVTPTPCAGQPPVCPTPTPGAPTQVAFTQTPTRTATPGTTPGAGTTTLPAATATRTPIGGPGGVLQPPDTGTGGASSGATSMSWIFAALGAGIAATLGLGIYGRRRAAKR